MGRGPVRICLYESDTRRLEPLVALRPVWELRAGALALRERWAHLFPESEIVYAGRPALAGVHRARTGTTLATAVERAGTLFVDAGLAPGPSDVSALRRAAEGPCRLVRDGRIAGAVLGPGGPVGGDEIAATLATAAEGLREEALEAPVLAELPDFVRELARLVTDDVACLAAISGRRRDVPEGVRILGEHPVHVGAGACIDPGTTLDAREGPITIGADAVVSFNTWLVGPASIGAGTRLLGGTIGPLVGIGPVCRVRGEVAESFFQGYTNKAHDGFIGHSVLGEWVNLGALTTCSDLKNTYSGIRVTLDGREADTGLTKLGVFLGDHVKTAIGTLLSTGSVVGVGANVFGFAGLAPKTIPAFAWGGGGPSSTAFDKFAATAERVMARRDVTLDDALRARLAELHGAP